jgi:transposase
LKNCRYALWKNPEDLTARQAAKLAWIARHNHRLYRAYLLKEQLRLVFAHRGLEAVAMLDAWLAWARRSQIPAFVELYHRIKKHRAGIIAAVTHGLSNGLTESVNTKLRLLTRIAYGSAPPTTSSPYASSIAAVTAHHSPADQPPHDPRIQLRRV